MKTLEMLRKAANVFFAILLIKPLEFFISFGSKSEFEKIFKRLTASSRKRDFFYIYSVIHQRATFDLVSVITQMRLETDWEYAIEFNEEDSYIQTLYTDLGEFKIKLAQKVSEYEEAIRTALRIEVLSGSKSFSELYIQFDYFEKDDTEVDIDSFEKREIENIKKLLKVFFLIVSRYNQYID